MIALVLALPLLMLAALLALDALEDWLFPPPEPAESTSPGGATPDHSP